jgi:2-polyprenyl-3-methyl-5-hydroxy-6-metoxy-1,4-benzoquinol methylase
MLDMARRAAQNAGVTELVELQSGDAGQVGELFEPKSFDLIVCHNVLEYVEHPAETLRSAAGLLKDSAAVFSIVVRNQIGEVLKAAIKSGNLAEAEENLTAERGTESLYGGTVLLLSAETLWQMLRDASLEVIANRGIRVVSDYLPEKVSLSRDYQRILDLELKLGRRPEFAAIARYMQCLVRCASREDKA